MQSKIQKLKQAMKNPPPERLAKIEYQSHFLNIMGVLIVCSFLVYKGYWYIIFAFIFSLGISYSQGMTAYAKYKVIKSLRGGEEEDIESDISPTRRRTKINKQIFGKYSSILSAFLAIVITYLLVGVETWYQKIAFAMVVLFFHIIIYFFIFYWISYPIYKRRKNK